ncbi:uncharacterized protein si:dkey-92i15.4 isoform X1 [Entelurus aequoreus]|uniref:uncharacterized protein si:dkey-92i15.4 isoform X1 n=1 Tax=Entelurus aequoreus TaxID=161455 RepID=UPI002B1D88CF|nr:uncharacterized protein si:dkey-92i15.4 isoform X1 [Entelurus aequoreus]XP_061885888.1 uncharacterized protein si:dkey-92i15.4 isoform X1 [Entelurus aequoreus]XP_061885889.1 uncharacterized protein si:dkey-92i15.4 isoform X1 [Entelurus aequoreus]XP_061885890.1 uncharacterized protein si:dkey-92i15.4 isoform X1 [Entelurus aequoreus]XP_061885891.1 uncharacterized protein si:dkey-92i15.4 isoform X1 [Entelurus aequoreus]
MDVSLLPTPVTEYTNSRGLACFTVSSANSPSNSLTRRPGVRRDRASSAEVVARAEDVEERGKQTGLIGSSKRGRLIDDQDLRTDLISDFQTKTSSGINGKSRNEENELSGSIVSSSLTHNDTIDKKATDFCINRSRNYNPTSESETRTDWRKSNLTSRSRSVDWRSGARSPDRGTQRHDVSEWSSEENKLKERDTIGLRGRSMSSFRASAGGSQGSSIPRNYLEQTSEAMDGENSFPLKLKSSPEAICEREAGSIGTIRGQSILERIEKLYGSSKSDDLSKFRTFVSSEKGVLNVLPSSCDEEKGGTFPRRGSSVEKSYYSPVDTNGSYTGTHLDTNVPDFNSSPGPKTWAKLPVGHWQERIYGRYSDVGGVSGVTGSMETMSLDRARSRNTIANQIRMARTAQSNTLLEQTSPSRVGSGSIDLGRESWQREKTETSRINRTQRRFTQEKGNVTGEADLKGSYEDEFGSLRQNFRENTLGYTGTSETLSPLVSVRNKINQFEALTQRSQGFVKDQGALPRRALSVPTRLNSDHDGLKSEATIGSHHIGQREKGRKAEEKVGEGQLISQSQRSWSVDDSEKWVRDDLAKKEWTSIDRVNKYTVRNFSEYSRLKHTPKSHQKEDPLHYTNLHLDEPDLCKVSSDKDWRSTNTELPSDPEPRPYAELSGIKNVKPPLILLAVTDDEKTPTNTPNHSPLCSPVSLLTNTPLLVPTEKEIRRGPSTTMRPLAASSRSNLADLMFPDVTDVDAKGKKVLDLDAWVAGWKAWRNDDDDDASTQKDDNSNYDSDSGESSVTITSHMSLSDRRSFSVSLAELCYFTGTDYESENDDEWSGAVGNRSTSLRSDMSALSYVSVMPSEELDKLLEDVRGLGNSTVQDDINVVVLHKEIAVGLGFSIAGGVDQNKPVTVHKVFPTGVAAQEGSIGEGDQVLSINGTALGGHTHWEALRVLRRAKTREMGVVVLKRRGVSILKGEEGQTEEAAPTQIPDSGQAVQVCLEKKSRDLGFSLEGGADLGDKPLTIQKIFQGGPVDKICPGDEVMEIQGVSTVGMRRLEAWTLIRGLPPGPVDMVVRRPCKAQEP